MLFSIFAKFQKILLTPFHILLVSLRIEMTLLICRHYIPSSQYSYLVVSIMLQLFSKMMMWTLRIFIVQLFIFAKLIKKAGFLLVRTSGFQIFFTVQLQKVAKNHDFFWYQFSVLLDKKYENIWRKKSNEIFFMVFNNF